MKKLAAATLLALGAQASAQDIAVHDVNLDISNVDSGTAESIYTNRSRISVRRESVRPDGSVLAGTLNVGPSDTLRLHLSAAGAYGVVNVGQMPNSAEEAISGDLGQVALITTDRSIISRTQSASLRPQVRYDSPRYGNHNFSVSTDRSANYTYRATNYGIGIATGVSHASNKQVYQVGAIAIYRGASLAVGINNDVTRARDATIAYRFNENWRASYTRVHYGTHRHNIVGLGYQWDSRTEFYVGYNFSNANKQEIPNTVVGVRYSF